MDSFLFSSDIKKISFPVEEYKNTYNKEPENFEILNVIAQTIGCFCFCITVAEIFKNADIKPSFKNPACNFIYELSDFEKNYINSLPTVRKNKLLSSKNYIIDFENENLFSGKAFISFDFAEKNNINLSIKLDFEKILINFSEFSGNNENLKDTALEVMNSLFKSIWRELQPQINKIQKAYMQKTLNHVPDYLKFATAPFIQELRRLMTSEKDKISIGTDAVLSEKITNAGNYVFEHTYTDEMNNQIIDQLAKMSDLTVDVLNGIIHILLENPDNLDSETLLSVDDLLFIRGKKASKNQKGIRGGYKDSQRKEILEHLELLSNLKIKISNTYIPTIDSNQKRNYEIYTGESPVIYIKKNENNDYYFHIKPGEVLALTLRGVGAKTGLIHRKVAEYDHYRNFWEKRLGNYFAWLWRTRQNKAAFLVPLTVESLLNQVGEENKFKKPQTIRNRLEDALYKLENDCVIKSWQYTDIDESILSGKNWFKIWLKHKIIIEPPVEILEEYSKIKKISNKNSNKFNFSEIIKIVKEKNLSQIRLAEETGISNEAIAGILSGKNSPNPSEKRKLERWVAKQRG